MNIVGWYLVISGWVFVGVLFVSLISSQRYWKRKRENLATYIIMLTLIDDVRNDHKTKFVDWINENITDQKTTSFVSSAYEAVENMVVDCVKGMKGGAYTASYFVMLASKKGDKGS